MRRQSTNRHIITNCKPRLILRPSHWFMAGLLLASLLWGGGFTPVWGQVAWYTLDETSGTVVTDSVGNDDNGTNYGATINQPGQVGTSYSFNGGTNRVEVPSTSRIAFTGPFSISAWVYPRSGGGSGVGRVLQKDNSYQIRYQSGGLTFGVYTAGWTTLSAANMAPLAAWTHVVAVFTGTQLKLYFNGTLYPTIGSVSGTLGSNSNTLYIGNTLAQTLGWDGYLDQVKLFNTVLSDSEACTEAGKTWNGSSCVSGGDTTPPSVPGTPSLTVASSTQINLSWAASTDNVGVTGYQIERCTGASCTTGFTSVTTVTGTPPATSYNNTGLTASTTYGYRLRAQDAASNVSGYTAIAYATTSSAGTQDWQPSGTNDIAYTYNNGNVGIGKTPNVKLDIQGTDGRTALSVRRPGGTAAHELYIDSESNGAIELYDNTLTSTTRIESFGSSYFRGGNVGIGTTIPSSILHITNTTISDPRNIIDEQINSGVDGPQLNFRKARGTLSIPTAVLSGDILGNLAYRGHDGTAFTGARAAVRAFAAENWSTTAQGAYLTFETASTGSTALTERMRIDATGNVGIGMTCPSGQPIGSLCVFGNIAAKYQDVAEWVLAPAPLPVGTVLVLDPERGNAVLPSSQAYDTRVAGVITDMPGILLGEGGEGKVKVATTGRVKIKVTAANGPIKVGDLLVSSDTPGVAMVSKPVDVSGIPMHRPGTIIGKALEPLSQGEGEILVLLSLQ